MLGSRMPDGPMLPSRPWIRGASRLQRRAPTTSYAPCSFDLTSAEGALTVVQEAAPDDERARHLTAIRRALEQLKTFR